MKIRMLAQYPVLGRNCSPNEVIDVDKATSKSLVAAGIADASPEAVDYCVKELGAVPIALPEQQPDSASASDQASADAQAAQTGA